MKLATVLILSAGCLFYKSSALQTCKVIDKYCANGQPSLKCFLDKECLKTNVFWYFFVQLISQFFLNTFSSILFNCLVELDKKSKFGKAAGYNSKQSFGISLLSALSAQANEQGKTPGLFNKYVNADKTRIALGLDSNIDAFILNANYLGLGDVYEDYLKYKRLQGINCSRKSVGNGVVCTEANASGKVVMGVLAPLMTVLGLYLN